MNRPLGDLALGARLAVAGGRGAWLRTAMTAVGVGIGVALLLLAASFPSALASRDARTAARDDFRISDPLPRAGQRTLLIADADTRFRTVDVRGRLVHAEGPRPPAPPGLRRLPRTGEVAVSPRLRALLDGPDGAQLRPRIPGRIVATIAPTGLDGPDEAAYYAGSAGLDEDDGARRIDRFGSQQPTNGLDPVLALLVVVAVAVLLVPVAVFVATAARFGGEGRDRRLAALRLVGVDRPGVRRVAAGESVVGAVGGLGVGAVAFLAARQIVPELSLPSMSFFADDLRPSLPLVLLVAVAVPALSVAVTQLALTRVAIDPLGVVRRSEPRRRRLAWRLAVPVLGLALLVPLLGVDAAGGERFSPVLTSAGVVLLLVGITSLLPWAVEAVVGRLDGGGGGVAWQLAVRRLQLESGASARTVSGIAVAVAGAIALSTLFSSIDEQRREHTGADPSTAQVEVSYVARAGRPDAPAAARALSAAAGTKDVVARRESVLTDPRHRDRTSSLLVAPCPTLRRLAGIGRCREGDSFVTPAGPAAGGRVLLDDDRPWRVPATARRATARTLPNGTVSDGLLATPSAVRGAPSRFGRVIADVAVAPDDDAAIERVRNAAYAAAPVATVSELQATREDRDVAGIRRGIYAGAIGVLALIAASMVVGALEGLHERRRLLASLAAFGTPGRTLGRSVLLQTAVPVVLGLVLALAIGLGLGAVLLRIVGSPVRFAPLPIALIVAAGLAVVPLVTAATLPALRRIVRPDGLRTE